MLAAGFGRVDDGAGACMFEVLSSETHTGWDCVAGFAASAGNDCSAQATSANRAAPATLAMPASTKLEMW
jgi:threonine dehydratase